MGHHVAALEVQRETVFGKLFPEVREVEIVPRGVEGMPTLRFCEPVLILALYDRLVVLNLQEEVDLFCKRALRLGSVVRVDNFYALRAVAVC